MPSVPTSEECLVREILSRLEELANSAGEETERPSLLEWTAKERFIKNRKTGLYSPFSLDEYLWLTDVYNETGDALAGRRIRIQKAAQVGVTEWAISLTGWAIDIYGARVFYALPPGQGIVSDFAHDRIDDAIMNSPALQAIAGKTDNVGLKTFKRGALYLRGTHIPRGNPARAAQLAVVPADVAIVDEWDRVPPAAIPLIWARLGDSHFGLEIGMSTPTYPGYGIDVEYQVSDRREPRIQCQACGDWHWLEWSLVAERRRRVALWCPGCKAAIEREKAWHQGRTKFEARNPDSAIIGYWIPKLVSPRADLAEIWKRSQSHDPDEVQAFWNNDLGLPYEPEGARLTKELIRACYRRYEMPDTSTWAAMGVDVGYTLNVWIGEPLPDGQYRAVHIGEALAWEELDRLMARYNVGSCVVDDAPELTADSAFAKRHRGRVFLATYVDDMPGAEWVDFDLKHQKVRVDRTTGLDLSHGVIEGQQAVLSPEVERLPGFFEQMTATLKARARRADGTVYYHFPRPGRPDHYDHAHVYFLAALDRLRKLRPPEDRKTTASGGGPKFGKKRYIGRL